MKKRRARLFFLIPLLYLGVLFLLVAVQFSKNETFSQSFGDLAISGKAPSKLAKPDEVLDLKIRGRGLEFFFSGSNPVLIETSDVNVRQARVLNYEIRDKALVIKFQYGLKLYFEYADANRKILSIRSELDDGTDTRKLTIPFRSDGSAGLHPEPGLPILDINRGGTRYLALLAGGVDRIDAKNQTFVLQAQKGELRTIRIEEVSKDTNDLAYWVGNGQPLPDDDSYSAAVKDFLGKAWSGWQSGRFHSGDATWDLGERSAGFSQQLVLAYLTEARVRGAFGSAYDQIRPGITNYPDNWGFPAMTYLGNLMDNYSAEKHSLEILAAKSTLDFTAKANLVNESFYHGPQGLFDVVQKNLTAGEPGPALQDRLAFIENLGNLKALDAALNVDGRMQTLLQTLFPQITRIGGGLYVLNEKGFVDLRAGLKTARLLLGAPDPSNPQLAKNLAHGLILSALKLADQWGQLPQVLIPEGDGLTQREGVLLPEEVYASVADNVSWPKEISLAKDWGSNAFLLTTAELTAKTITAQEVRLTFTFPEGYSHGFILQGVPPFDHIKLHDTLWRTDSEFQQYSDGWYYRPASRTLFVKLKHRQPTEQFVLKFGPEDE